MGLRESALIVLLGFGDVEEIVEDDEPAETGSENRARGG